jgi:hypothetical protein
MNLQTDLYAAVAGLLVCTVFILWWTMRSRNPGVGLLLGYWLHFLVNYGIAGVMHTLPWVNSHFAEETAVGFPEAVLSLFAFCVGAGLTQVVLSRSYSSTGSTASDVAIRWATPKQIFVLGVVVGYMLAPLINKIPSGSAVSSTLASLTFAAWGVWVFQAARKQSLASVASLLVGTVIFPLSSIIQSGFLGFGASSVIVIVSLTAVYLRPRMLTMALGVGVLYLGMSVYLTYMRDRVDIRDSVWGGDSFEARTSVLLDTFGRLEWLNPDSEEHIQRIDARMNQNSLFGLAIGRLERGEVDYWRGESLLGAMVAAIPRILWPDKPTFAGSGNMVSELTGLVFQTETSIGIGPIMEFYANFGRVGMLLASLFMGAFLGLCDLRAGAALRAGHTTRFATWLMLGLPLHQMLGSLISISSSLATAVVLYILFRRFWERRMNASELAVPSSVGGATGSSAENGPSTRLARS